MSWRDILARAAAAISAERKVETKRARTHEEALIAAYEDFQERNVMCPAPGCEWGVITLVTHDPDTFIPHTDTCVVCAGRGYLPRQMELPL